MSDNSADIATPSGPDRTAHRPVDLVVTGADLVATMDGERRELAGGWVAITDGLVEAVGAGRRARRRPREASTPEGAS